MADVQEWLEGVPDTLNNDPNPQWRLEEKFLSDLSEHIPSEWEKLGAYLEVCPNFMSGLRLKATPSAESWASSMLWKWVECCEDQIDLQELCEAFEHVHRGDLIEEVRKAFPGTSTLNSPCQKLQDLICYLSSRIGRDWYKIGINLYIQSATLDAIKINSAPPKGFDPTFELLKHWNNNYTGPDRLVTLKNALQQSRRNDVVRWIEEQQQNSMAIRERRRSSGTSHKAVPNLQQRVANLTLQTPRSIDYVDNMQRSERRYSGGGCANLYPACTSEQETFATKRISFDEPDNEPARSSDSAYLGTTGTSSTQVPVSLRTFSNYSDKYIDLHRRTNDVPRLEGKLVVQSYGGAEEPSFSRHHSS